MCKKTTLLTWARNVVPHTHTEFQGKTILGTIYNHIRRPEELTDHARSSRGVTRVASARVLSQFVFVSSLFSHYTIVD